MTNDLSPSVQMQFMRPDQLEAAARAFPVVYIPFGLIEWHGKHLPLGTDSLKAHGILVKTAEQFGGAKHCSATSRTPSTRSTCSFSSQPAAISTSTP